MLRLPLALAAWLQACAAATASSPAAACGPPPKAPWPAVADLPACGAFPDPWLRSDNTRVSTPAEWQEHRSDMVKLLEQYMYGHAPEQPPVRSTLTGSAEVERYCERVRQGCNGSPSERNVTDCAMRCLPLETPQTLRNYTLRVGPSADKTWPFDVFVYTPKGAKGPLPFVIYNGEGFYSGVEYGDLTAQGAKVLLDRGFGLALFNRNELRKVRFNKTHAFFFLTLPTKTTIYIKTGAGQTRGNADSQKVDIFPQHRTTRPAAAPPLAAEWAIQTACRRSTQTTTGRPSLCGRGALLT